MRSCLQCGASLEGRSSRARYCGSSCRSKATLKRQAEGVVLEVAARTDVPTLVDAVRRELDAAGRTESVAGAAALVLAARIEAQSETGAAVAALVRQLHATMTEATGKATTVADPLDELRARREARRGA